MFKKAVDSHNATKSQQPKPAQQQPLFSAKAGPTAPQQPKLGQSILQTAKTTRPLSTGSGNIGRVDSMIGLGYGASDQRASTNTAGLKRTSSGLMKALGAQDAFGEKQPPSMPTRGSQQDPLVIDDVSPKNSSYEAAAQAVYFDEDDFDSDIDLDIDDPTTKGSVNYPSLPSVNISAKPGPAAPLRKVTPPFKGNTDVSRPLMHPKLAQARDDATDSGHGSQITHKPTPQPTQAIPWSSSPPEHFETHPQAAALRKFTYSNQKEDEGLRPVKRRTLPWAEEEERKRAANAAKNAHLHTPLPNGSSSKYAWDASASKMQEAKKNHRETQKAKTTKTPGGLLDEFKKKKSLSRVFLSDEQQSVLNMVVEGQKSVFFTGSAGTGKSVLLREIITSLKKKYQRETDRVAVTASTGLAACNIGGVTLHSFAGIGIGKEPVEELVKKIKRNQKNKYRWTRTKVLIIDEVSMIDGALFDKLENCARILRNNGRPFGGIQLVITGDFFQLPPVAERGSVAKFCFDAATWNTSIERTIGLTHVFRQKDPIFAGMLNEMREGRLTPSSTEAFKKLNRPITLDGPFEATELFPTRNEVDNANRKRMSMLHGEVRSFEAKDGGTVTDKARRDKMLSSCMAPEVVHLKKGAQVMLIKNIDETLVNGSLGRVIGFMSEQMFDNYQAHEEDFLQGRDVDGDGYDDDEAGRQEARKRLKMNELLSTTSPLYPLVRFSLPDGTTRDLLCQREQWKNELPNGEVQASRSQVPLILAWALSIHKAQGQTLERVKVDLGKVFEKGQAYVALSRATNMAGLQVLNFDSKKVVAHDRVRNFYASLGSAHDDDDDATAASSATSAFSLMKNAQARSQSRSVGAAQYERAFVEDDWADEGAAYAYG